jgi:hypothetical protein
MVRPVATVWTRLLSLVLSVAVLLLAVAPALATSIQTDLWVYQYGDTVSISGDGFGAFEDVEIVTTDPFATEVDRGTVQSDDSGYIHYSFVLLSDVPGIYDVVATGLTSGLTASTQFDPGSVLIDNATPTISARPWFRTVAGGFDVTLSGSWTCNTSGNAATRCNSPTSVAVDVFPTNNTPGTVAGSSLVTRTFGSLSGSSGTWSTVLQFRTAPVGSQLAIPVDGRYDVQAVLTYVPTTPGNATTAIAVSDDHFGVDNTGPLSQITSAAPTSPFGGNFSVSGTATDGTGSGLAAPAVIITLRSGSPSGTVLDSRPNNATGGNWTENFNPTPSAPGTYCFVSEARDRATNGGSLTGGNLQNPVASQCWTIAGANTAPTISDIADQSTNEDTSTGAIAFTVGDAETAPGSLTVSGSSSNTTLVPNANITFGGSGASRTVSIMPAANQFGTSTITITVSDGSLSTSDTFVLTVNAVNDAPVADDETVLGTEDTTFDTLTSVLLTGDTDVEGDTLVVIAVSGATGGTATLMNAGTPLDKTDDFVRFNPNADLCGSPAGGYDYTVSDGNGGSDAGHVTVNLTCVNDAPVVVISGTFTAIDEGMTRTYTYVVSDVDSATWIVYESCSGNASYIADLDPNSFQCKFLDGPGTGTVTVTADDGELTNNIGSDSHDVTINNVAPSIAISGAASVNEGSSYSLTLGAVTDPGTDTVSSYVVHWGDGNSDTYATNGAKTHTYLDGPNSYNITVDLTDEDGTFTDRADPKSVTVNNVKPNIITADSTYDGVSGNINSTVTFADPGADTETAYFRYIVTGTASSTTTHSYPIASNAGTQTDSLHLSPGCYNIQSEIWVTDSDGAASDSSVKNLGTSLDFYQATFEAPIKSNERNIAKYGNVVPIKVTLLSVCVPGTSITTANLFITIADGNATDLMPDSTPVIVAESVSNADTGSQMRVNGGGYIFNFSTKPLKAGQDYTIRIRLGSTSGPILLKALFQPKK